MARAGKLMCQYDGRDRGWAWVILASAFINWAIILGTSFSFGVYYGHLLHHFKHSMAETAWVGSINTLLVFSSGPLTNLLTGFFSYRVVIIIGGLLAASGCLLSVFATQIWHLIITYGIICGLGFGLAYTPSVAMVGLYFARWRSIALSVVQAGVGTGCLLYAPLSQIIMEKLGWQGAMLATSGLCLQMCITGALMRPPDFYEVAAGGRARGNGGVATAEGGEAKKTLSQLCNLDVAVLKDVRFLVLWCNNLLWNAGFIIVFVIIVDYLCTNQNFPKMEAVVMLSIIAITNTIGRPIAGLLGTHKLCNRMYLYNVSTCLYGIVICLYVIDGLSFEWYAAFSTLFGLFLGMQCGILPIITADMFGVETLVSTFGYLMISNGVGNMIGPPIAGWMVEKTGSFQAAFYLASSLTVASSIMMFLVPHLSDTQKPTGMPPRAAYEKCKLASV
ncbi:PREDICTED: monocarboxylate transporter 12-B-like [Priapulus caudatus]|uniref:Monocarboxylate transporter 12-B-like n=1 Tax=Priapulus caudatus TaxID=37621 RepID=A0ABM1DUF2_PRICU|nr:PREDICTED: monocarboxylate transporter 12-B-like [Priapulus caudatus]